MYLYTYRYCCGEVSDGHHYPLVSHTRKFTTAEWRDCIEQCIAHLSASNTRIDERTVAQYLVTHHGFTPLEGFEGVKRLWLMLRANAKEPRISEDWVNEGGVGVELPCTRVVGPITLPNGKEVAHLVQDVYSGRYEVVWNEAMGPKQDMFPGFYGGSLSQNDAEAMIYARKAVANAAERHRSTYLKLFGTE